jgi:hypothetical protein
VRAGVSRIGAGAAGMMAAIYAANAGADTLLLERTRDGGRKILISGGGRCNILPARLDERRFVTDSSPNTLRNIVRSWPLEQQIMFFEQQLGLTLVEEEESAKLFPASNRARDVRDGLLALAARHGVQFHPNTFITGLSQSASSWRLEQSGGEPFQADSVIVATGGLSVPATGSDVLGLTLMSKMGHTVHTTYPALTPIVVHREAFGHLAGISVPVTITAADSARRSTATGGFLFTHRGYSGPSVLDVSHIISRSRLEGDATAQLRVQWTRIEASEWEAALKP